MLLPNSFDVKKLAYISIWWYQYRKLRVGQYRNIGYRQKSQYRASLLCSFGDEIKTQNTGVSGCGCTKSIDNQRTVRLTNFTWYVHASEQHTIYCVPVSYQSNNAGWICTNQTLFLLKKQQWYPCDGSMSKAHRVCVCVSLWVRAISGVYNTISNKRD